MKEKASEGNAAEQSGNSGEGSRKRKANSPAQEGGEKKYTNILFSCVTVRQLRELLNKVEKEDQEEAARREQGDANPKVDRAAVRRLVASKTKSQRGVKRNRQKTEKEIGPDAFRMKTFPVATISMGLFIANGGQTSDSHCNVTFCFYARHVRYDFLYSSGSLFYRAGYKIAFNHLEAITFRGNYVHFKLSQPAEQEYCNRESMGNYRHTVVSCNGFDITQGQYKTALIHVIRMYSDESSEWIHHLLDADRQFFEPLIRKADGPIPAAPGHPNVSLPALSVDPVAVPMYGSNEHLRHDAAAPPICLPPPSYIAQPGNLSNEAVPMRCTEIVIPSNRSAFMPYPLKQEQAAAAAEYNGGGPGWQQLGMYIPVQLKPYSVVQLDVASPMNGEGSNVQNPVDMMGNGSVKAHHDKGPAEEKADESGPSTVDSMYVLSKPEPVDSEYFPQKSDSQYILSDLDCLLP